MTATHAWGTGQPPPNGPNPWTALPQGQDIQVTKGYAYAAVASIRQNLSQQDITNFLAGKGLSLTDYAEQGQRPSIQPDPDPTYKTVAMMTSFATADGGTVPWGPIGFLKQAATAAAGKPVGTSHAEEAWSMPQSAAMPPTPPAAPSSSGAGTVVAIAALAGGTALAIWLVRRHKHRHP